MDVYVSGDLPSGYQPEQHLLSPPHNCSKLGSTLDDLFFTHNNIEGDDVSSMEWLSTFVEDCFSSSGNCLIPPLPSSNQLHKEVEVVPPVHRFAVPSKTRSKRKRSMSTKSKTRLVISTGSWSCHQTTTPPLDQISSDPPLLLQQAYWLADSELILPKKPEDEAAAAAEAEADQERDAEDKRRRGMDMEVPEQQQQQPRRCTHCLAQRTPQWRAGPMGPKTLCNACGVRYKSGRLLPEYRPAKSPTFVTYKHSNSHKKVLEMRMGN